MRQLQTLTRIALTTSIVSLSLSAAAHPSTRTLETRFALSADVRSEFSTSFPLLSAGRIIVEANWNSPAISRAATSLTLILIRPDGTTAASKSGTSVLRLDHGASDQDTEKFAASNGAKWTVKILNDANANRTEVSGTLRITIPAASRTLEDTQFTLLGSGNAQEIPFNVPAPGKIQVDVSWGPDVLARPSDQVALVVSLIHPGESRTYARRQGASPIRVEQQVTEPTLDLGMRWVVRVQNGTQTKVMGRIEITYTPSL
jgi:hypothetical protein